MAVVVFLKLYSLESEQQKERHHKTEETHSLRQGETQDGVWEQLLFERGVPCVTDDEGTKYRSDTRSWKVNNKLIKQRDPKSLVKFSYKPWLANLLYLQLQKKKHLTFLIYLHQYK